tara:strand:+ start:356 stop:742 length:387 start_codon:yes stop_codon:yes gene_type:complete
VARVTVEDCVLKIPNRFQLVMFSAQRARNISAGASLTVDKDNDKNHVIALREIADETLDLNELEEGLITGLQRFVENEDSENEELDLLPAQQNQEEGEESQPPMEQLSSMYVDAEIPAEVEEEADTKD